MVILSVLDVFVSYAYPYFSWMLHWHFISYDCLSSSESVPWASYQVPSPRISDPDMQHGTCVTHVPWCRPGSLASGFSLKSVAGKTFPAFPAHAQPTILRIWQEAHAHIIEGCFTGSLVGMIAPISEMLVPKYDNCNLLFSDIWLDRYKNIEQNCLSHFRIR